MISTALSPVSTAPAPAATPAAPAAAPAPGTPADAPAAKPFARLLHAATTGSTREGRRPAGAHAADGMKTHADDAARTQPVKTTTTQGTPEDTPTDGPAPVAATAGDPAPPPGDAAALLAGLPPLQPRPLPPPAGGTEGAMHAAHDGPVPGSARSPVEGRDAVSTSPPKADGAAGAGARTAFADALRDAAAGTEPRGEAAKAPAADPPPLPQAPLNLPTATTVAASAPAEARIAATPGSADFATQLGAQLTTFVRDGIEHARLELHPVELGPVTVQIQLDGSTAQVNLSAEHAPTREALQQALPELAGSLREAGLTLTGGGVFEQPRQSDQSGQSGRSDGTPARDGPRSPREAGRESVTLQPLAAPRRRGVVDLVA